MSPTSLDIKCSTRGCNLPVRIVKVGADYVVCKCADGHRRQYTRRYFKRFLDPKNIRADVPQECPVCHTLIRDRTRTAQNDAKEIGRADCSVCETTLLYDPNTRKWIIADD